MVQAGHSGVTATLGTDGVGGIVRRTVLPGGLRVLTETMPSVRSVTFGVLVAVGSRDESVEQAGASHYLEHLLFKGTARRSALDISSAIDAVGGEMNAFTGKEYTCFYASVLDADLPLAVDVICDMITSARIRTADVESERGVILEEIAMHEDDPASEVHDEFTEAVFGDAPLGRPILGTEASIETLSRDTIAGYYGQHYAPPSLVVAAAGNLDHDTLVAMVLDAFGDRLDGDATPLPPRLGGTPDQVTVVSPVRLLKRPCEQANVVLGVPGLARTDERRHALGVLNAALGGGMSSRLFQEVREKRGLAYSVHSYTTGYADAGVFGVYAGCLPRKTSDVLAVCRAELAAVGASGLTEAELARGKGQVRGSLVLGLEDPASRMVRLGKAELLHEAWVPIEEVLAAIDAVTVDDVSALAAALFTQDQTLAVVGPFDPEAFSSPAS